MANVDGNRFINVGGRYYFKLTISSFGPMIRAQKIILQLGQNTWYWNTVHRCPLVLNSWVQLPLGLVETWNPIFFVEGFNNFNSDETIKIQSLQTVTTTNIRPIFNSPLSCSLTDYDQPKIQPIRRFLNRWGILPNTLGYDLEVTNTNGKEFLKQEKDWAIRGDCFIAILTRRDASMDSGQGLPTAWNHAEAGLSYTKDKPQLLFLEKGVRADAMFNYFDDDHIIEFEPYDPNRSLNLATVQMQRFRQECEKFRSTQTIHKVVKAAGIGFGLVGLGYALGKL